MQRGARAYVAEYNLDLRDDRKIPSAEKLGYELFADVETDYHRLKRKGNLFSTEAGRKLFWMLHAGVAKKMEAIEKRTTADMDWPAVITYFGTKTLEFYRSEGLQDGYVTRSPDNSKYDGRLGADGIYTEVSDITKLN